MQVNVWAVLTTALFVGAVPLLAIMVWSYSRRDRANLNKPNHGLPEPIMEAQCDPPTDVS